MLTRSGLMSSTVLRQCTGQTQCALSHKSSKPKDSPSKRTSRKGSKSRSQHDSPTSYDPSYLITNAVQALPYVTTKSFQELRKKEKHCGNDGKSECYKNPGYYRYQRFSYYELMMAMNAVKPYIRCYIE
ncbi:hypothetical protein AWZ03_002510 [Drosophila navojoa]|uniref:Uncharacterized protein n=1 Tax=Drosophila navojoa TaxID=7232 RepID=A0A484BQU3_DRONA|nr:hypothetical protein AWZ03_002510 [Drosophila navojoa]